MPSALRPYRATGEGRKIRVSITTHAHSRQINKLQHVKSGCMQRLDPGRCFFIIPVRSATSNSGLIEGSRDDIDPSEWNTTGRLVECMCDV
jgi:hypothetical protein